MKKIFGLLIIFCILFSLTSCNRRVSRVKPVVGYSQEEDAVVPSELVLENQFLLLRFITSTGDIILRDKQRGTEWHSTPVDVDNDRSATVVTMDLMKSQFALQYADVSGVGETLYSHTQSIEKGNYNFDYVDNGIEVNYTIGNIPRTYIIPITSREDRFRELLNTVNPTYRGRIEASYRLYDIHNLRSNDNRAELLEMYPDLAHEKLWIIRESTQEFMKADMEDWFAEAGYTREEYMEDAARQVSAGADERPAFSLTIRYELQGRSLIVSVPYDSIAYRTPYPPLRIDLLPFFGAASVNDEGYMLVPDGSGALIYFNNGKHNQINSNLPLYGWDEAMPRDAVIIDPKASFPVFGIHRNGEALVGIIEEGSAYARVNADVSGRNSSYNRVYPWFSIIHGAVMDISGRSDRAVFLYENGLPAGERIKVRYTITEEPGYVGMAKEYRRWLQNNYLELAGSSYTEMPIAVQLLGAVNKTQHRLGIPFDLPLRLTTYREMNEIVNDLSNLGWKDVRIKLSGWFNHSYDHRVPNDVKLIRELGSRRDFERLQATSRQNGFHLFPEADFMFVRDIKFHDGFSLYRDASRYVTRERVEKYPFSFVWFGERIRWGKLNYLVRPEVSMNLIDDFMIRTSRMGINNVAFRNMGSALGGDYHERRHVSREASMRMRETKFNQLHREGKRIMITVGNSYSVPWADIIVDMALDCQGFAITDVSVPFYQIALSGMVPYTGKAINLAEDYTMNVLNTIESGAGLYFSFMKEESVELQETKFRQFYANEYDKWIDDANELYQEFSRNFAGLWGQQIVDHRILAPGITETEYRDGTVVLVNKNDETYNVRRRGR